MAPPKETLPPGIFEAEDDSTVVVCRVCSITKPFHFKRNSLARHIKTAGHVRNGEREVEMASAREEMDRALREEYADGAAILEHDVGMRLDEHLSVNHSAAPHPLNSVRLGPSTSGELYDSAGNRLFLTAGTAPKQTSVHDRIVREYADNGVWGDADTAGPSLEDATITEVQRMLAQLSMDAGDAEDVEAAVGMPPSSDWFPYKDKTMFLCDLIDNMPRLRMSNAQLSLVLWVMREAGGNNIPALKALKGVERSLRAKVDIKTHECRSSLGNLFYQNDIGDLIGLDYANPQKCRFLHVYPEEDPGGVSEAWHTGKWLHDLDDDLLTPMYARQDDNVHFYVKELASLNDGRLVIPLRWVEVRGVLHAWSFETTKEADGHLKVIENQRVRVAASEFNSNYMELCELWGAPPLALGSGEWSARMPNPLRAAAAGRPCYTSMLVAFGDGVSGNVSKQYNEHCNLYFAHANLPSKLNNQEFFVRFLSTSPHAGYNEQFNGVVNQIRCSHAEPIPAYHYELKEEICLRLIILTDPADNPQHTETCSGISLQGNLNCRGCLGGGSAEERASDEGYHSMFSPGELRVPASTVAEIETQILLACEGALAPVTERQTATGVKDKIAQFWIEKAVDVARQLKKEAADRPSAAIAAEVHAWVMETSGGEVMNELLELPGLDVHRDTPVEILHTYSLGIVKYTWHHMHTLWSSEDRYQLFAHRLQAVDMLGLSIPPIRGAYLVRYRNGLIGKHFKQLAQTMAFVVEGTDTDPEYLVDQNTFNLIKATGELGPLLWYDEIQDMEQYRADLDVLIGNLLDIWSLIDPKRILDKFKLHGLTHVCRDVLRHGPPKLSATEMFECFNFIFRLCSVLSNHLAPSRDISRKFVDMERFKHIVSGGYWRDGSSWVQAGPAVRQFFHTQANLQSHLGWASKPTPSFGEVKYTRKSTTQLLLWDELPIPSGIRPPSAYPEDTAWQTGTSLTAANGDKCVVGSWVFVKVSAAPYQVGRILALLRPRNHILNLVLVKLYNVGSIRHSHYGMPKLSHDVAEPFVVVDSSTITCDFHAHHDCHYGHCQLTGQRVVQQERQDSGQTVPVLEHTDDDYFLINTHAHHNAALIRSILPRTLTAPKPYFADRRAAHDEAAVLLREVLGVRRVAAAAKRKETSQRKKAAKDAAAAAATAAPAATATPSQAGGEDETLSDASREDSGDREPAAEGGSDPDARARKRPRQA